eukprot:scaffold2923_cov313-Pinguiococcus_pyrenoidosus.AAC.1
MRELHQMLIIMLAFRFFFSAGVFAYFLTSKNKRPGRYRSPALNERMLWKMPAPSKARRKSRLARSQNQIESIASLPPSPGAPFRPSVAISGADCSVPSSHQNFARSAPARWTFRCIGAVLFAFHLALTGASTLQHRREAEQNFTVISAVSHKRWRA